MLKKKSLCWSTRDQQRGTGCSCTFYPLTCNPLPSAAKIDNLIGNLDKLFQDVTNLTLLVKVLLQMHFQVQPVSLTMII